MGAAPHQVQAHYLVRDMPMIIQNRDDPPTKEPGRRQLFTNKRQDYYAAVPADLLDDENAIIDELISFACDSLGSWRLDIRVYEGTAAKAFLEAERSCEIEISQCGCTS
jgi:hypothetical protein